MAGNTPTAETVTAYKCPCCKQTFSTEAKCNTHIAACAMNPGSTANDFSVDSHSMLGKCFKIGYRFISTASTAKTPTTTYGRKTLEVTTYDVQQTKTISNATKAVAMTVTIKDMYEEEVEGLTGGWNTTSSKFNNEVTAADMDTQLDNLITTLKLSHTSS